MKSYKGKKIHYAEFTGKDEQGQDPDKFPTQIIYMDNIFYAKKESKLIKLINEAK